MSGRVERAGLVGTAAIRSGKNREVLDRVRDQGRIFAAWSDQDWVNEGADVRVSIVCFEKLGSNTAILDGQRVDGIGSDLTAVRQESSFDSTKS